MTDVRVTAEMVVDGVCTADLSNVDGDITIAPGLGAVRVTGCICATRCIVAGVGTDIEAGGGIEAGMSIKAGGDIKAGDGIEAGWGIQCAETLSANLRIMAGLVGWRLPTQEEMRISCHRLVRGTVALGQLEEKQS